MAAWTCDICGGDIIIQRGGQVGICDSCGASHAVAPQPSALKEFSLKMEEATTGSQRISLIRNFPVPDTKEDLFEFLILAVSNIGVESGNDISDAWLAKLEQCYHKSRLLYGKSDEFAEFEKLYSQTKQAIKQNKLHTARSLRKNKFLTVIAPSLPHIVVTAAWIISLIVLIPLAGKDLDAAGFSPYQLLIMLDLIAGTYIVPPLLGCPSVIPKVIVTVGMVLVTAILIPLCGKNLDPAGFNAYQLVLIVGIISAMIIARKYRKSRP